MEEDPPPPWTRRSDVLAELVERSVRVKAEVVAGDLRETGGATGTRPGGAQLRAHARPRDREGQGYAVRHGEAVSVGMVYVAELARLAGRLDDETAARHAAVLALGRAADDLVRARRSTSCWR